MELSPLIAAPFIAAPWVSNLDPDPVDSGIATVTACDRSRTTRMSACQPQIVWQEHGTTADVVVHSPRDLEPGDHGVVARRPTRSGSRPSLKDLDRMTVVPADMPANTGTSVVRLTALNVGAAVVIWGTVIARSTGSLAERPSGRTDRRSGVPRTSTAAADGAESSAPQRGGWFSSWPPGSRPPLRRSQKRSTPRPWSRGRTPALAGGRSWSPCSP